MNFSTFGPFSLRSASAADMVQLWREVNEARLQLSDAVGVYLVVRQGDGGRLIPCYVGKTDKSFGYRVAQHVNKGRFNSILGDTRSPVSVFLIALVTGSGRFVRNTVKSRESGPRQSISRLEFILIGSCLTKNSELLNKQVTRFHKLIHVPGYLNSQPENYDDSARQLAEMLQAQV